jgi:hypothetical protein
MFVLISLGGCTFIATTTNGITNSVESVSDATSSTTDKISGKDAAFVETRFAAIRSDAARGYGENLDSLAVLLGEQDRAEFAGWMKQNYAMLFSDLSAPRELLARIESHLGRDG